MNNDISQFGDFSIFGFVKSLQFLEHKLPNLLGSALRTIDFGTAGTFFFYSSYGDLAEAEDVIVLKLGFLRSPTMLPLSAKQLLSQKSICAEEIDHRAFGGNALVVSFDKRKPGFQAFKTLMSAPQLYYSITNNGILCATTLKALTSIMDCVEVNQDAIVSHFLFSAVHGSATFFRNVYRLFPGELLQWKEGGVNVKLVQDLRFSDADLQFDRVDQRVLDTFYERFKCITHTYINDIGISGQNFATLLSGGIDSSFLQLVIKELQPDVQSRTFSYTVEVPSFEREVEYAKQASAILDTKHTFISVTEQDYPDLLIELTKTIAQPVFTSVEPCKFAIVQSLSQMSDAPRFLFTGQGADTLFGSGTASKLKKLGYLKRLPALDLGLRWGARLLASESESRRRLLHISELLRHMDDPHHFIAPINTAVSIEDFTLARRAFGDEAVQQALEDRREREAKYLDSKNSIEKVIVLGLLSDCYANQVQSSELFLSHGRELLSPFEDQDVIRLSFAFPPEVRYVKGLRHKYILKDILEHKITTPITRQPKGGSMFHKDLFRWMQSGSLRDMINDISLPGFLKRQDVEEILAQPQFPRALILWHLLAWDVFQKQCF
ncbi:MAG: asparagine synthase [Anaerolineae bacterium]|nr:asparagine synthase [Anaerolineae bacterium]